MSTSLLIVTRRFFDAKVTIILIFFDNDYYDYYYDYDYPSIYVYIYLSIYLSIIYHLSIYISIYHLSSIYLSNYLSIAGLELPQPAWHPSDSTSSKRG